MNIFLKKRSLHDFNTLMLKNHGIWTLAIEMRPIILGKTTNPVNSKTL